MEKGSGNAALFLSSIGKFGKPRHVENTRMQSFTYRQAFRHVKMPHGGGMANLLCSCQLGKEHSLQMSAGEKKQRLDVHNSDIPELCRSCEARHKGICGALNADQLTALSKITWKKVHEPETELVASDKDISTYSNILSGVVKLTKLMADGRQQIVGLQFAPDFLGRPFKRQSGVIAEAATDVRVCSFPASFLEEMIADSPELEHRLHEQALKELDEARDWMLTLGRKTAGEKVASFLLMIASHIDPDALDSGKPISFELPLKRSDIADFLGLTIETVSRQITKLRQAGVIEIEHNRTVIVSDLSRLENAAETER